MPETIFLKLGLGKKIYIRNPLSHEKNRSGTRQQYLFPIAYRALSQLGDLDLRARSRSSRLQQ
jgi:hypothetical protein